MDIIITIIFILTMIVFNIKIFQPIFKMKDEVLQNSGFMLLGGFNILATTTILFILHPEMADNLLRLAIAGFVGGIVLFVISILPYRNS